MGIKKEIIFSNKLLENVLYLNDSFFLIFLREFSFKGKFYGDKNIAEEFFNINDNNNIIIAKIEGNYNKIIFETLINCEEAKIFYSPDINDNIYNLINQFISVKNNIISVYELINIKKKIEIKNN